MSGALLGSSAAVLAELALADHLDDVVKGGGISDSAGKQLGPVIVDDRRCALVIARFDLSEVLEDRDELNPLAGAG